MISPATGREALRLVLQHHEDLHAALRELRVEPPAQLVAYLEGMRALSTLGEAATEREIQSFLDGVQGALQLISPAPPAKPSLAHDVAVA